MAPGTELWYVYKLFFIHFIGEWILNKALSRLIYNPHSVDKTTLIFILCVYAKYVAYVELGHYNLHTKNVLNAKEAKNCVFFIPIKNVRLQARSSHPIFTSMAERMSNDSEDSDLAVAAATSRLPPALTLSNECRSESEEK